MTLPVEEFIRRFLLHALPDGFQRIRFSGFLANRHRRDKLLLIAQLLSLPVTELLPLPKDAASPVPNRSPCPFRAAQRRRDPVLQPRPDPPHRQPASQQSSQVPRGSKPASSILSSN